MTYVMGIDGGGSTIRVAIVTPNLTILGQSTGPTVNPSVVKRDLAATRIQTVVREALAEAGLSPDQIAGVGLGIAGASADHSTDWLRQVITPILPASRIVLSADYEIALVGATGERRGVLILAGTGSLVYGVNTDGESALVGGWGYLLGDEGGGYWVGLEGLRAVISADDGSGPPTALTNTLLATLGLSRARALIPWLYQSEIPRTREIAALAPLVLEQAAQLDMLAAQIARRAAHHLAMMARTVCTRLGAASPAYAFTGGLITTANPLSRTLCDDLGLAEIPAPRHTPVVGAALLALTKLGKG